MDLDSAFGKALYVFGVFFAAIALIAFGFDVVFDLAITTKAVLLFLAFAVFFVGGWVTGRELLGVLSFVLAGVAYLVFLGYVALRLAPGADVMFLLLAGSAVLFVGLGYAIVERELQPARRTVRWGVLGVALVGVALVGFDIAGPPVTYETQTVDSVTVEPPSEDSYYEYERRVGTMTVTNDFAFTRTLSLPVVRGCIIGTEERFRENVWVEYETPNYRQPTAIAGDSTRSLPIRASLPVDRNATAPVTYAVERGSDCSVERDEPTLLVSVGEEMRY